MTVFCPHCKQVMPGVINVDTRITVLSNGNVFWKGIDLRFSRMEFSVVRLLASSPGTVFTHRSILDAYRGPGFAAGAGVEGYFTNVRSMVKRVRGKFKAIDPSFDAIEVFNAIGYRWRDPTCLPLSSQQR